MRMDAALLSALLCCHCGRENQDELKARLEQGWWGKQTADTRVNVSDLFKYVLSEGLLSLLRAILT